MKALKSTGRIIQIVDIENTLEALQKAVDGYIETVYLDSNKAVMLVNEEGLLRGMSPNPFASAIAGTVIVGPAIIIGVDGEEFTDVPEDIIKEIVHLFGTMETEITREGAMQAFKALRRSAETNSLQEISLDEINAEIDAARNMEGKEC